MITSFILAAPMETGKTMHATYDETMKMIAERRAKKAAAKRAPAGDNGGA